MASFFTTPGLSVGRAKNESSSRSSLLTTQQKILTLDWSNNLPNNNSPPKDSPEKTFCDVIENYLPNKELVPKCISSMLSSNSKYLNVYRGDIVLVLRRIENNLSFVRLVNRIGEGLVPNRFLSINLNLSSLGDSSGTNTSSIVFNHTNSKHGISENPNNACKERTRHSESNMFLLKSDSILSAKIVNSNFNNKRLWYQLECVMASGNVRILYRYYQDFYMLHLKLIESLKRSSAEADISKLPHLPPPNGSILNTASAERLESFNKYLRLLLASSVIPSFLKQQMIVNECLYPRIGDMIKDQTGIVFRAKKNCRKNSEVSMVVLPKGEMNKHCAAPNIEHKFWVTPEFKTKPPIICRASSAIVNGTVNHTVKTTNPRSNPASPSTNGFPIFQK